MEVSKPSKTLILTYLIMVFLLSSIIISSYAKDKDELWEINLKEKKCSNLDTTFKKFKQLMNKDYKITSEKHKCGQIVTLISKKERRRFKSKFVPSMGLLASSLEACECLINELSPTE